MHNCMHLHATSTENDNCKLVVVELNVVMLTFPIKMGCAANAANLTREEPPCSKLWQAPAAFPT